MTNKIKLSEIIQWSFRRLKPFKASFIFYLLLGFLLTGCNILVVYYTKRAIKYASGESGLFRHFVVLLLLFVFVQLIAQFVQKHIGGVLNANVAYNIKRDYQEKLTKLSRADENSVNSGDIISRFNSDLNTIVDFVPNGLYQAFFQMTCAVVAAVYLASINAVLLAGSIILIPIAMFLLNKLQGKMGEYFYKDSQSRAKATIVVNEAIENIQYMKSYNLEEYLNKKIKVFYDESLDNWIHIHKIFSPILMLTIILREFPKFTCVCFGGWLALKGYLSLDELVGFVMLLGYIVEPIINIPQLMVLFTSAGTAIQRYSEIMDLNEERTDGAEVKVREQAEPVLELRNVNFSYSENGKILDNISFQLNRGEQIAIVGESGSGKSTIMSLLIGDYEAASGNVLLYGQDYKTLSLESIRKHIALVSQNVTILPMSVRENIAIGNDKESITEEEIKRAAKLSGADKFIEGLAEKYDTYLGENGVKLSGGQCQMLSIARAFLKDAPIILLDEPTSALDAESEMQIRAALKTLLVNKSVIIISHRLSTVCASDRLLILNKGVIADQGSHEELLERNTYYKEIYMSELAKGVDE